MNAPKKLNKPLKLKNMKRIFRCICLAFLMLLSVQAFSQNYAAPKAQFVPAKAILVGDGFEVSKICQVAFDVDTLFNCADFQMISDGETSDVIHFTISYVSDSGTVLHMDYNTICVMEDTQVGKACKLTVHDPMEGFSKLVFLFYLIE